ncbi:hypothetical protein QR680_005199 [Steinernema hermaphroditum]|uniref:Uncharacterized protein n=1 Tax=Steinernema hermaphroditum TaxID=289476 RepID=A0AA39LUF2_9BILA|nr:hypothetical protein QR680_005199 [Steinernema hermaphroditum]
MRLSTGQAVEEEANNGAKGSALENSCPAGLHCAGGTISNYDGGDAMINENVMATKSRRSAEKLHFEAHTSLASPFFSPKLISGPFASCQEPADPQCSRVL